MIWRFAAFAALASAVVGTVYVLTAPAIETARETARQAVLREVAGPLITERSALDHPLTPVWPEPPPHPLTATQELTPVVDQGQRLGYLFSIATDQGYSGTIELLMATDVNWRIVGVRTLSHRETPGLGDGIDLRRSDWMLAFNGLSMDSRPASDWTVRQDGGAFDSLTGATITSRAVIHAVRDTLDYLQRTPLESLDEAR